jgi:hypothetical protein
LTISHILLNVQTAVRQIAPTLWESNPTESTVTNGMLGLNNTPQQNFFADLDDFFLTGNGSRTRVRSAIKNQKQNSYCRGAILSVP